MPKNEEALFRSVRRGMSAAAELDVVTEVLTTRKEQLITKAITAFNSQISEHRMTERDALLFVASLAENQRLHDDLVGADRDGQRAAKQLIK